MSQDPFEALRQWLGTLKKGDQVLVSHRYHANDCVAVVERVTACYLTVQGVRYNRATGYACGDGSTSLRIPTPDHLDRIEARKLRERLGWRKWEEVPLAKLRAVVAVLDAKEDPPCP